MSGINYLLDTNIVIGLRRAGLLKLPDAIVAASALDTGARLLTLDQRLARVIVEQGKIKKNLAGVGYEC